MIDDVFARLVIFAFRFGKVGLVRPISVTGEENIEEKKVDGGFAAIFLIFLENRLIAIVKGPWVS